MISNFSIIVAGAFERNDDVCTDNSGIVRPSDETIPPGLHDDGFEKVFFQLKVMVEHELIAGHSVVEEEVIEVARVLRRQGIVQPLPERQP